MVDGGAALAVIPRKEGLPVVSGYRGRDTGQIVGSLVQVLGQPCVPFSADLGGGGKKGKEGIGGQASRLPGGEVDPRDGIGDGLDEGDAPIGRGSLQLADQVPSGAVKVGEQVLGTVGGLVAELGEVLRGHGGMVAKVGLEVGGDGGRRGGGAVLHTYLHISTRFRTRSTT